MREAAGETFTINISNSTKVGDYLVDLGDGVIFVGTIDENILTIEEQVLNEGGDFDVVTFSGQIIFSFSDRYFLEFTHEVDQEGESTCESRLVKQ